MLNQFKSVSEVVNNVESSESNTSVLPDITNLLAELKELWRGYDEHGLEVRFETGRRVNLKIGPPTGRQPYKAGVMREVAETLDTHVSEVCRMRWFSHRFGTFEAFRAANPGVTTWTDVKALLAVRPAKAETEPQAAAKTAKEAKARLRRTIATMRKVASTVSNFTVERNGRDAKRLCDAIQQIIDAAQAVTGVSWVRSGGNTVAPEGNVAKAA
jgi:hypothetical protein